MKMNSKLVTILGAVALATTSAVAKPSADTLHFSIHTSLTDTGVEPGSAGSVSATEVKSGAKLNQNVTVTVTGLTPTTGYTLNAVTSGGTVDLDDFTTDSHGKATLHLRTGNGNGKTPQLPPLPTTEISLHGLYVPPPPVGFEMGGDALARQTHWPKNSIFLDPAEIARDLGRPLYPRMLALDADPASIYVRVHTLDFSSMPPARHRAYAFQWFTFALAAVVILLAVHRKRKPRKP